MQRTKIAKEGVEHFNQQTGYPIKDVSNNYSMFVDRRWIYLGRNRR
jgi:hypothetical protein